MTSGGCGYFSRHFGNTLSFEKVPSGSFSYPVDRECQVDADADMTQQLITPLFLLFAVTPYSGIDLYSFATVQFRQCSTSISAFNADSQTHLALSRPGR